MAGGVGTRLRPFTKVLPKPLVPVNNKPIIDHIIDRFRDQGLRKIILTSNDKAEIKKAYFNETKTKNGIKFLEEKKPLGTCGGLSFLRGKILYQFIKLIVIYLTIILHQITFIEIFFLENQIVLQ